MRGGPTPVVLVADELLTTAAFRIGPGWLGPDVKVVVPAGFDDAALHQYLPQAAVVLTAHRPITADLMDAAPALRLVAKPGAGVDNIDVAAAQQRGIVVTNVPGARAQAVAEHAAFLMLALARRSWMYGDPAWRTTNAYQLSSRTLGIVGLGAIGSRLAPIAAGLGMKVIAATRTRRPAEFPDVDFLDLKELLGRADVVVLCPPLTEETQGMIDRAAIEAMKPDALLINVGRGPLVVTDDLTAALQAGALGGVGLDVTDPEPLPPDHPLHAIERVLITPHNAGRTDRSQEEALARMRANVASVLRGEGPLDPVAAA